MVKQRRRKTVPPIAKNLFSKISLWMKRQSRVKRWRWQLASAFSPIFVKHQHAHPNAKQHCSRHFTCPKCPTNVRNVVKEDVRKRWIPFWVRHTLVNHNHHKCGDPCDQECVACECPKQRTCQSEFNGVYVISFSSYAVSLRFLSIFICFMFLDDEKLSFSVFIVSTLVFVCKKLSSLCWLAKEMWADDADECQRGSDSFQQINAQLSATRAEARENKMCFRNLTRNHSRWYWLLIGLIQSKCVQRAYSSDLASSYLALSCTTLKRFMIAKRKEKKRKQQRVSVNGRYAWLVFHWSK